MNRAIFLFISLISDGLLPVQTVFIFRCIFTICSQGFCVPGWCFCPCSSIIMLVSTLYVHFSNCSLCMYFYVLSIGKLILLHYHFIPSCCIFRFYPLYFIFYFLTLRGCLVGESWGLSMNMGMNGSYPHYLVGRSSILTPIPCWNENGLVLLEHNLNSFLKIQIFILIFILITNQMLWNIWPFWFSFQSISILILISIAGLLNFICMVGSFRLLPSCTPTVYYHSNEISGFQQKEKNQDDPNNYIFFGGQGSCSFIA